MNPGSTGQTPMTFTEFSNCVKNKLIDQFLTENPTITLTQQEREWLVENFGVFNSLEEFTNVNQPISTQEANLFQLHLNTMANDPTYFIDNSSKGFPVLGTEAWAESFVFRLETTNEATLPEIALTIIYPYEALLVRINVKAAREYQQQFYGAGGEDVRWLGKGDAFLHTLWHAFNASDIGRELAKDFGDAHEFDTPAILYLESEMDFWNNEQGYIIGHNNPTSPVVSQTAMVPIVQAAIQNGLCKYLHPVDHNYSKEYGQFYDPITGPQHLNGILWNTELKWTNQ